MIVNTQIHAYLQTRCWGNATVLEIGAGQGTVSLSKLFKTTAIEHDPQYLYMTNDVEYIHAPLIPYSNSYFRKATLWYDDKVIEQALNNRVFDAIIVDGPKGNQGRGGFYTHLNLFKANIYIFDDTHRLWDFRLAGRVADKFKVPFKTYTNGHRWFSVVEPKRKDPDWNGSLYGR